MSGIHPRPSPSTGRATRGPRSATLLALLVLAACSDEPMSPDRAAAPPAANALAADAAGEGVAIEPEAFKRFSVEISTAGAYRPGVPVQIHARTTAHMSSPQTSLRVVVPELDGPAAEPGAASKKARPPARKPSRDEWTASLASGATNQHVTSVVFPRPGIYHVAVEAEHPAEPGALVVGARPVQHAVGEVVEVEVSERGIRTRAAKGPVAMGSSIQMIQECEQPYSTPGTAANVQLACEEPYPYEPPPPPPSNVVWVWTAVWYSGPQMSTYDPVRRARVNYSGYGVPTGQSTTDEGGYVLLPCNPSNGQTSITVTLDGADIHFTYTYPSVSTTINMGTGCYGGGWVAWYNWSEGRSWDNLLKAIDGSRAYFGFARGRVNARVGGPWPSSCPTNISCFKDSWDELLINPADVWGLWGEFTTAHEYGHAVHYRTPAGMNSCGGSHSWGDASQDPCLAHNEGWATYVAFAARGAALNPYYQNHANDAYRTTCPGGNCETRVTALLLDLSEASVDPYGYGIQLPARHVFDMTAQCTLTFQLYDYEWQYTVSRWSQSRRNGVSEIVDCLKKDYPVFRGSMMYSNGRMVDIILDQVTHPWPKLVEPTRSAVIGRASR
ncbi:MAG TPA: hypothetical protein VFT45_28315 [Longimicrobium sp.]|nr:hypothetical protein [Longimicrobium sp.]